MFTSTHHWAFLFGVLGNIVSFMVFLAPVPTFYRIVRKKSTEGYQSLPYSVALFSATLTLYYGLIKINGILLITINTVGCVVETIYLILFMIYATKGTKISTAKLLILFNAVVFGSIVFLSTLLAKGPQRVKAVGLICAVFSVSVFVAPLGIIKQVIKTKSVEFMPFPLSFFLTLSATVWFLYGYLMKDYYVATPSMVGFCFGIAQMILYMVYRNAGQHELAKHKLQELPMTSSNKLSSMLQIPHSPAPTLNGSGAAVATTDNNKEGTTVPAGDLKV